MKFFLPFSLMGLALLVACQTAPTLLSRSDSAPASAEMTSTIKTGRGAHDIAAAQGFIYNSHTDEETLSVIDSRQDKVVKTLTLKQGKPGYIKAFHNESHVLLLNPEAGLVHIIDPKQEHALIYSLSVGSGPNKVVISPDDKKAWISLTGEAAVTELDFSAGMDRPPTMRKLSVGKGSSNGHLDRSLALGSEWLAVFNPGDNDVSLFQTSGNELKIKAGNNPSALAFVGLEGNEQQLVIGNNASNTISFYDLVQKKIFTLTESYLAPTEVAVIPELKRVFVSLRGSNEVVALDVAQKKLLGRVKTGLRPGHIYLAPTQLRTLHTGEEQGPELWVANDSGDSVTVFDGQTLAVKRTLAVGKGHHKMAFAGNQVYVSNITDGTVSVLKRD